MASFTTFTQKELLSTLTQASGIISFNKPTRIIQIFSTSQASSRLAHATLEIAKRCRIFPTITTRTHFLVQVLWSLSKAQVGRGCATLAGRCASASSQLDLRMVIALIATIWIRIALQILFPSTTDQTFYLRMMNATYGEVVIGKGRV
jgi:hypothetical protein